MYPPHADSPHAHAHRPTRALHVHKLLQHQPTPTHTIQVPIQPMVYDSAGRLMTVDLVFTIMAREFWMPWEPMPESRKPWKGKWSGPRAGAPLICKGGRGGGVGGWQGGEVTVALRGWQGGWRGVCGRGRWWWL